MYVYLSIVPLSLLGSNRRLIQCKVKVFVYRPPPLTLGVFIFTLPMVYFGINVLNPL